MKKKEPKFTMKQIARAWNLGVRGYAGGIYILPHYVMGFWGKEVAAKNMRTLLLNSRPKKVKP